MEEREINKEIIEWLWKNEADCSDTGQVYTQYGNQFNIIDVLKQFIFERTILK